MRDRRRTRRWSILIYSIGAMFAIMACWGAPREPYVGLHLSPEFITEETEQIVLRISVDPGLRPERKLKGPSKLRLVAIGAAPNVERFFVDPTPLYQEVDVLDYSSHNPDGLTYSGTYIVAFQHQEEWQRHPPFDALEIQLTQGLRYSRLTLKRPEPLKTQASIQFIPTSGEP